jgi:hypothetical protein
MEKMSKSERAYAAHLTDNVSRLEELGRDGILLLHHQNSDGLSYLSWMSRPNNLPRENIVFYGTLAVFGHMLPERLKNDEPPYSCKVKYSFSLLLGKEKTLDLLVPHVYEEKWTRMGYTDSTMIINSVDKPLITGEKAVAEYLKIHALGTFDGFFSNYRRAVHKKVH